MKVYKDIYNKLVNNSITTKQSKYHNKKVEYDGHTFDSQKEKAYYIKLKLMEKADEIFDLELQKEFVLIETFKLNDKTYRKMSYYADFTYLDKEGKYHIIDVKGIRTKEYLLKKKLLAWKYGLEIEEV
ncbi:DUF1064 domain-containing protein [bacterium]|nr:DUF1064 domain-containing protein [bacterium]